MRCWIKYYELVCENCGSADHYQGTLKQAKMKAKSYGYIQIGTKWFCDQNCVDEYEKTNHTA